MSASTGSSQTRAAWIAIIQSRLEQLQGVCSFKETIPSENDFRVEFFKLPNDLNVPSVERNYRRFIRLHGGMESIARELDKALSLNSPESLSDVLWNHALAGLQTAMKLELRFPEFVDMYVSLNNQIPRIALEVPQFPRDERVQAPLQRMFETYIHCYLTYITQFAQADDKNGIDRTPIISAVDSAEDTYTEAEEKWRAMVQEARDAEQLTPTAPVLTTDADVYHRDPRFEHIRILGKGSYGVVDEVREATSSSVYARKSIPTTITGLDSRLIENRVKNEFQIMGKKLRHNHIAGVNIIFKDENYWSMIMLPVADCDLRYFLDESCVANEYPYDKIRMLDPWFGCLISALAFAHMEMVKHEDIKPHNILIQGRRIYLTDFGTAKDFSELEQSTVSDYLEAGTPVYWAPEDRPWGRPADVFALGCVFSEMLTVRQRKSLDDYKAFRYAEKADFHYAYRSSLPKVKVWLKSLPGVNSQDPVALTVLEQTLMMIHDTPERLEAQRVKKNLSYENTLFCHACL